MALYANSIILPPLIFQLYPYNQYTGLTNMAIDHYIATNSEKTFNPIFRFYGWKPYCISLGYHQSENLIDKQLLKSYGYDFITRPTGGRAIFHSEELTYSIIFPKNILSQQQLYIYIHETFTKVLNKLDYNVVLATNKPKLPKLKDLATDYPCFTRSAETEVEYDGKKIIGSAQKKYPNSILQHGSILIGDFHRNLSKFLITNENERYIIDKEIKSKTICLNKLNRKNITPQQIEEETLKQLESDKNISLIFKELKEELLKKAQKLYIKEFNN